MVARPGGTASGFHQEDWCRPTESPVIPRRLAIHARIRTCVQLARTPTCVCDDRHMPSRVDPALQASVIVASFENRHAAEHFLASLGRDFRKQARKGRVSAFVTSGNKDGSLKLTQSRVVTKAGIEAAIIGVFTSMMVGFMGIRGTLKGVRTGGHAMRVHSAHVGSDEQAVHAILAQAGPDAAIAMVCCDDPDTRQTVASGASGRAIRSWAGGARNSWRLWTKAARTTGCAQLSASLLARKASVGRSRS